MHFVIMGCGRVGSVLARGLERHGHSVAVIDVDVEAFRRLGPDFQGRTIKGVGFDRAVLARAGIKDAHGFAAVSSGDNSNIMAARVVREEFGLANVAARIYDHGRSQTYEKLGIPSVSTVRWTAIQIMNRLLARPLEAEWRDETGDVELTALGFDAGWVGMPVAEVEARTGTKVAAIRRAGKGMVPSPDLLLQDQDVAYFCLATARLNEVATLLEAPPASKEQK
jgi:trk system potassium uptake protein TrkA